MSKAANSNSGSSLVTRYSPPDVYDDGHLRVEHDNYYVSCEGQPLRFRRAEFLLLYRLARNLERVVKAEELWRHAWGDRKPYNAESLHGHVYRLRAKLAPFGVQIETMVNVGYRLVPATVVAAGRPASHG